MSMTNAEKSPEHTVDLVKTLSNVKQLWALKILKIQETLRATA